MRPSRSRRRKAFLKQGHERARRLRDGKAPWTTATGLVVRGYVSKIDGSVQPYGLVVPASYKPDSPHKHRLDLWCHGRGENLTELNFIDGCQKVDRPSSRRPDAFVLHLYGRYCYANKFAGEIDAFEALDNVKKHYPIDENRIVVRGFSMGGAACWQFAVHYPSVWAAAAPGAGFSRDGRLPEGLPERDGQADVVRAEALAHVRLHRLRRQPLQPARRSPTAARSTSRSRPPT